MSKNSGFVSYVRRRVMDVVYVILGFVYCKFVGAGWSALVVYVVLMGLVMYPAYWLNKKMLASIDEVGSGHEED